jgi:MarC family integral membrane protein
MLTPAEKQFALLAFSSLFSVINPISAAPIFVAMTADFPERRRRAALRACLAAAAVMAVFAAAGGAIFAFFGITVPAFQIAGGVIFAAISVRTLQNGEKETPVGESVDPSIVPLGIPVIAGPGTITTVNRPDRGGDRHPVRDQRCHDPVRVHSQGRQKLGFKFQVSGFRKDARSSEARSLKLET